MTYRTFYSWVLVLPLLLPLAAGIAIKIDLRTAFFSDHAETLYGYIIFIGLGGLYGAIPYGLVAGGLLLWFFRENPSRVQYRRAVWAAPVLVAGLGVCIILLWQLIVGKFDQGAQALAAFFFLWAVIIGYCYALAIALAALIAEKTGLL